MTESLLPREHGAYAQLTFPILSGLLLGRPGVESFCVAAAAILLFLAHEPLLVLLGGRGARRQRTLRREAVVRLFLLLPPGVVAGGLALLISGSGGRLLALVSGGLVLAIVPFLLARREKSIPGEFLVAGAMASLHATIGHGAGLRDITLWGPALLWFAIYAVATLAVHAVRGRGTPAGRRFRILSSITGGGFLVGSLVFLAGPGGPRWLGAAAIAPAGLLVLVSLLGPSARHLKRIGWTIVAGQVLALLSLLLFPGGPG